MKNSSKDKENRENAARRVTAGAVRSMARKPLKLTFSPAAHSGPPIFGALPTNPVPGTLPSCDIRWSLDHRAHTFTALRAMGDTAAFHQRYSNPQIHDRQRPVQKGAAMLFDMLERARCDTAGTFDFPGAGDNIRTHLNERAGTQAVDPSALNNSEMAARALYFMARRIMGGEPAPAPYAAITDRLQDTLEAMLPPGTLDALPDLLNDQDAFAKHSRQLIHLLNYDDTPRPQTQQEQKEEAKKTEKKKQPPDKRRSAKPEKSEEQPESDAETEAEQGDETHEEDTALQEDKDGTDAPPDTRASKTLLKETPHPVPSTRTVEQTPMRRQEPPAASTTTYRVYTREFDQIIAAEKMAKDVRSIDSARQRMDDLLTKNRHIVGPLANRLQRKLMAREQSILRHQQDLEEGVLDATRLTRAIIDPVSPLMYKQELDIENRNTIVTILVDNSGSMRGHPIMTAALSAELMAKTLERCGVKTEILGFTTSRWKGGQSHEKWLRAGRPENPGRMNDLRHIIYKGADTAVRHARRNMALMANGEELLKENIDGEGLEWAYGRLRARPEKRRILFVISDGAPVDDVTLKYNNAGYLDNHLREIIARIQNEGLVEVIAIGIGHDVKKFYKNSIVIPNADTLGETLLKEVDKLFETPRQAARRRWQGPGPAL